MFDLVVLTFAVFLVTNNHFSSYHSNKLVARLSIIATFNIVWNAPTAISAVYQRTKSPFGDSEFIGFLSGICFLIFCSMSWILSLQKVTRRYNIVNIVLSTTFYFTGFAVLIWARKINWTDHQSNEIPTLSGSESMEIASKWAVICYLMSMLTINFHGGEESQIATDIHSAAEIVLNVLKYPIVQCGLNLASMWGRWKVNLPGKIRWPQLWRKQSLPRYHTAAPDDILHQNPSFAVDRSSSNGWKWREYQDPEEMHAEVARFRAENLFREDGKTSFADELGDPKRPPEVPKPRRKKFSFEDTDSEDESPEEFPEAAEPHPKILSFEETNAKDESSKPSSNVPAPESFPEVLEPRPDNFPFESEDESTESDHNCPPGSPTVRSLRKRHLRNQPPPESPTISSPPPSLAASLPFYIPEAIRTMLSKLSSDQEEHFYRRLKTYQESGLVGSASIRSRLFADCPEESDIREQLRILSDSVEKRVNLSEDEIALVLLESLALYVFLYERDGPIRMVESKYNDTIVGFGDVLGCTTELLYLLSGHPNLIRHVGTDGGNGIIVFNGNFISNGELAIECEKDMSIFVFLLLLQLLFPEQIVLVLGVNERQSAEAFEIEMRHSHPNISTEIFPEILKLMPTACVVDNVFFFCPEGIPWNRQENRPMTITQFKHVLECYSYEAVDWMDVSTTLSLVQYDSYYTELFLKENKLKLVVRANLPTWGGVDTLCQTVFSDLGCVTSNTSALMGSGRAQVVGLETKMPRRFQGCASGAAMLLERESKEEEWMMSTFLVYC